MDSAPSMNSRETESDLVYALRDRISDLEKLLGQQWRAPKALRLTPSETRILGAITKRPMTNAGLYTLLYGERYDDPPDEQITKVYIHRIRARLSKHDISIETDWGVGYSITPDNLKRLNALYGEGEQP